MASSTAFCRTVGVIQPTSTITAQSPTSATSPTAPTEFGFDYLCDNMKFDLGAMVQRGHQFASSTGPKHPDDESRRR